MKVFCLLVAFACVAQASEFLALSNSEFLHYPETQRQKLSEYDVSNLLARILHVSSPSELGTESLPVVDIFHGPKVAVMLSVEGAADSDVGSFDNIAKIVKKSQVYEMDSNSATPALSTLKMLSGGDGAARVTDNLQSDALKLCASSDELVSMACGPGFTKLNWHSEERHFASEQLPLDLSPERLYNASAFWNKLSHIGTLDTHAAKFVTEVDGDVDMDLNEEVVDRFFSELSLFAGLPHQLAADNRLQADAPHFVYLSLAGLQKIADRYGRESSEFSTATRVLDAAVPAILAEWRAAVGSELQELLYLKETGTRLTDTSVHTAAARRKLLAIKALGDTNQRTVYSLSDIAEYQIVLWMSILGVIVVFASAVALGTMGFKEDDAGLYSSFKSTEDYGEMRHGHVHDD